MLAARLRSTARWITTPPITPCAGVAGSLACSGPSCRNLRRGSCKSPRKPITKSMVKFTIWRARPGRPCFLYPWRVGGLRADGVASTHEGFPAAVACRTGRSRRDRRTSGRGICGRGAGGISSQHVPAPRFRSRRTPDHRRRCTADRALLLDAQHHGRARRHRQSSLDAPRTNGGDRLAVPRVRDAAAASPVRRREPLHEFRELAPRTRCPGPGQLAMERSDPPVRSTQSSPSCAASPCRVRT